MIDLSKIITAEAKAREVKLSAITARVQALLAAGYPAMGGPLHIAMDDGSRADMTAMATTAVAAASGAVPWPESYQIGWITVENIRLPLPTPAAGLALAAAVGDYYATVRQNGRSLKDAVLSAETVLELDAINIDDGWPEG